MVQPINFLPDTGVARLPASQSSAPINQVENPAALPEPEPVDPGLLRNFSFDQGQVRRAFTNAASFSQAPGSSSTQLTLAELKGYMTTFQDQLTTPSTPDGAINQAGSAPGSAPTRAELEVLQVIHHFFDDIADLTFFNGPEVTQALSRRRLDEVMSASGNDRVLSRTDIDAFLAAQAGDTVSDPTDTADTTPAVFSPAADDTAIRTSAFPAPPGSVPTDNSLTGGSVLIPAPSPSVAPASVNASPAQITPSPTPTEGPGAIDGLVNAAPALSPSVPSLSPPPPAPLPATPAGPTQAGSPGALPATAGGLTQGIPGSAIAFNVFPAQPGASALSDMDVAMQLQRSEWVKAQVGAAMTPAMPPPSAPSPADYGDDPVKQIQNNTLHMPNQPRPDADEADKRMGLVLDFRFTMAEVHGLIDRIDGREAVSREGLANFLKVVQGSMQQLQQLRGYEAAGQPVQTIQANGQPGGGPVDADNLDRQLSQTRRLFNLGTMLNQYFDLIAQTDDDGEHISFADIERIAALDGDEQDFSKDDIIELIHKKQADEAAEARQ